MSNEDKYLIKAGGLSWEIGMPFTAKPVIFECRNQQWPMEAVKAVSSKGTFLIVEYSHRLWNPRRRPFDYDMFIALDSKHRPLVQAAHLHNVLWSLATGRDPSDLDVTTTATLRTEPAQRPPQPRVERRPSQHSDDASNAQPRPASAQRQGIKRALFRFAEQWRHRE